MTNTFTATSYAEDNVDFYSSALDVVAHNRDDNELYVEFKSGGEYVYEDIPESLYNLFVGASSLGHFYREYIAGEYTSNRVYDTEVVEPQEPLLSVVPVNDDEPVELPQPEPSKYGVRWSNGALTFEPNFSAVDEDDAIDQFFTEVAKLAKTIHEPRLVKVLAVVHYLD